MLAKILSQRHGFDCTVLFSIDPATGTINPNIQTNVPGLEALAQADLMIIATRFRKLTEAQLAPIAAYLRAGKPVIGLRTATHAFTGDAATTYSIDGGSSFTGQGAVFFSGGTATIDCAARST